MTTDSPAQSVGSKIMTFTPSKEEFKDFNRYIAYMESQGAHKAGMAKVIPPKGWKPRKTYDDIDNLVIPAPIQQVVTGQTGLFTQYNIQKKPLTVSEFRNMSNLDKYCHPQFVDYDELERKFWKNLTFNPPLYGADVSGTLYDTDVCEWNIGRLNTILDMVENESGVKIKGVNTPYLYFGMWKSSFAWHTEDMDLYSINYLHFGEPKSWYAVPPDQGKRMERLARGFFPGNAQGCEAFLRHKMTLISPLILKKFGIPIEKVTQEAGQFIITFPFSYHAGFNHGYNCAESTNFATQRWIDYGKHATMCTCRQDMVKISMDVFVRKYQPDRYKLWKAGKDHTPIDHSKLSPEAEEFLKVKSEPKKECEDEPISEVPKLSAQEDTSCPKPETGIKRKLETVDVSAAAVQAKANEDENDEVELKKAKLSSAVAETVATDLPDVGLEKNVNLQSKVQSKNKKALNKKSPLKKEKNGLPSQNSCPPHLVEATEKAPCPVQKEAAVESELNSTSPAGKQFQRTLSPADVLHVHSYAKGDYAEEETPLRDDKVESEVDNDSKRGSNAPVTDILIAENLDQKKDLGQLPGHHPLIKDGISHEGATEDSTMVEEEGLEGESWAKPLAHLWQSRPPSMKKEREYNHRMGSKPPYCSICLLFHTYKQIEGGNNPMVTAGEWMKSKPLIPEVCFTTTTEEDSESKKQSVSPYLEDDGTSLLISCSQCSVRVHTSCYGVDPSSVSKDWKCVRCKANALKETCCLCSLRGGALQKANNNKWVHVLCALAVQEARFVNVANRCPVDLSGIPLQRFKLKCYYCKKRMKKATGCCVQCSHGRCPTAYHPTCAQAAGVLMQPDDWPFVVHVTCCRHKGPTQIERNKAAMQDLSVGQKVICKHKNGRYYQCDVVQLSKETFYEVNFDDGSFSDNLFPEDIVNRDCAQLGPPPQGEAVQVRWTDGLVYGAKFVAAHVTQMYLVEFEDGSQLTAKRDDVYSLDEELPKRVKSRLSKASDMRFDGIFEEKEIIRESKRQRVINSRYRGDYIEPVIYRAIME
ncbi:lysine-specific demethylase 4A-like [Synchiropus splendidus]|uniref:lysine-specific demethylase 4A-like n=1 Tax=Synchiropus splendidus TaxID=270530 RepID=UPI00237E426E|nr:lysine-specific demethylase 4A-like [Synchiropus splendidus]